MESETADKITRIIAFTSFFYSLVMLTNGLGMMFDWNSVVSFLTKVSAMPISTSGVIRSFQGVLYLFIAILYFIIGKGLLMRNNLARMLGIITCAFTIAYAILTMTWFLILQSIIFGAVIYLLGFYDDIKVRFIADA